MTSMVGGSRSVNPIDEISLPVIPRVLKGIVESQKLNNRQDEVDHVIGQLVMKVIIRYSTDVNLGELSSLLSHFSMKDVSEKSEAEKTNRRNRIILAMSEFIDQFMLSKGYIDPLYAGLHRGSSLIPPPKSADELIESLLPPSSSPSMPTPIRKEEQKQEGQAAMITKLTSVVGRQAVEIDGLKKEKQDLQNIVSQLESQIAELTAEMALLRSTSSPSVVATPAKKSTEGAPA